MAFHCQQAFEKCLKGRLILAGLEAPRSHDLVRLQELLAAAGVGLPLSSAVLEALAPFAVSERYPSLSAPEVSRTALPPLVEAAEACAVWLEQALRAGETSLADSHSG